jgi:tetratricopeptide (TPR) repeat protein
MRKQEKLLLEYSVDEKNSSEAFTYFEIAFATIIFIVVLYLLYPKGMLKKQVLQEQSNYELTAIYLKNMLRLEPDNTSLILATARILLREKRFDLAYELINVLKNTKDRSLKKDILLLEYDFWKSKREKEKRKEKIIKIKNNMKKILNEIAKLNIKDTKKWYLEAIDLGDKVNALRFLETKIKSNDLDALENCVYISSELKKIDKEIECLDRLTKAEKEFPKKWIIALYSLYLERKNYKKAYEMAKKLAKVDPDFNTEPAKVNLMAKNYEKASKDYMNLYKKEINPKRKADYLFGAIRALEAGGKKEKAVRLAKEYQERFLNNDEVIKRFIKFYLSISNLKEANALAKKILNIESER